MKLIKYLSFTLILMVFYSCEVDDICTEELLTPKLIVRFYDASNMNTTKQVQNLYVWASGKDSLYNNIATDSIVLPLNISANETVYLLSANAVIDTLYLNYERKEIFVSRSCGYKINFELTPETHLSGQWTDGFTTVTSPQLIKDETAAHIKIYH